MRRLVSVSALLTVLAATSLHAQNVAATADVPAATAKPAKVKKEAAESTDDGDAPAAQVEKTKHGKGKQTQA